MQMRLMAIAMSCIKKSFQSVTTKGVMMNDKAMIIFSTWADKLPENASLILREKLEKLPKEKLSALSFIQLKDPIIELVLGIFVGVFGIDRFYKGDIGLGIVKLLLCWATLGI